MILPFIIFIKYYWFFVYFTLYISDRVHLSIPSPLPSALSTSLKKTKQNLKV